MGKVYHLVGKVYSSHDLLANNGIPFGRESKCFKARSLPSAGLYCVNRMHR